MDYVIRYAILDSNLIFNQCGPMSTGPVGRNKKAIQLREEAAKYFVDTMNKKQGFFTKLEKSILKEGFRNPIVLRSGYSLDRARILRHREYTGEDKELLICVGGGSRLWIAEKHKMKIPCIISDFMGRFAEEIPIEKTKEAILEYYTDEPNQITFNSAGIVVNGLPPIHLTEK